jgi:hypothetical protein
MRLREYLHTIAETYDRSAPLSADAQRLLRGADKHLTEHVPAPILIVGSGGKGFATFTPWVGFFDPQTTSSPQSGIYVVYIFDNQLTSVTLALLQGVTEISSVRGWRDALTRLADDASMYRSLLGDRALEGLGRSMTLGVSAKRQAAYEAASIAALRYDVAALPDEEKMRSDLRRFLSLYRQAIELNKRRPPTPTR